MRTGLLLMAVGLFLVSQVADGQTCAQPTRQRLTHLSTVAPVVQVTPSGSVIRIADVVVDLFDLYNTRDVFVFTGPPLQIQVPAPVAPPVPAPPVAAPVARENPALLAALGEDGALLQSAPKVQGYTPSGTRSPEPTAPPGLSKTEILARITPGLTNSCATCHTAPKSRADFNLFASPGVLDPKTDWRLVDEYVTSQGGQSPRMPKRGHPPLTPEVLADIKTLKGMN